MRPLTMTRLPFSSRLEGLIGESKLSQPMPNALEKSPAPPGIGSADAAVANAKVAALIRMNVRTGFRSENSSAERESNARATRSGVANASEGSVQTLGLWPIQREIAAGVSIWPGAKVAVGSIKASSARAARRQR